MEKSNQNNLIWEILPLQGLGSVYFNMTRDAAQEFLPAFGKLKFSKDSSPSKQEEDLRNAAKLFGFSQEDLEIALDAIRSCSDVLDGLVCDYYDSGVSFEFKDGLLIGG